MPVARKRRLSRGCSFALGAVVLFLILVVGVLWLIESRYEGILRAPRVSHRVYTRGDTALRVVLQPPLAQHRLVAALFPDRQVPDWVLNAVTPAETTLLFNADVENRSIDVNAFINYARLGPVLRDTVNKSGYIAPVSGINWSPPELVLDQPGVLLLRGTVPMSPQLAAAVQTGWDLSASFNARDIEGSHLLEALLENRNGRGFAALGALVEANTAGAENFDVLAAAPGFRNVATVRLFADFEEPDSLHIELFADAVPGATVQQLNEIKVYVDMLYIGARTFLRDQYAVPLLGNSAIEGNTVHGVYTLSDASRFLGIVFGTQAPPP